MDCFVEVSHEITICYRDHGNTSHPAVLLIAGLGEDCTYWGEWFIEALVDAGFRVITMDNRDVGQSSHLGTAPPALWRQALTKPRDDAYSLADMGRDCIAVLDALELPRVHLVGRSMGAMIAQAIASSAPERARSLTSIYSTTGARDVGQPTKATIARIAFTPRAKSRTDAVRAHLALTKHVAGTGYEMDDATEAAIAAHSWDRSRAHPADGVARQIEAIGRSGDRTSQVRQITAPTLVIHGDRDLMVAPSGGRATADAIVHARHLQIPGMGHHLPQGVSDLVVGYICELAESVDADQADLPHGTALGSTDRPGRRSHPDSLPATPGRR